MSGAAALCGRGLDRVRLHAALTMRAKLASALAKPDGPPRGLARSPTLDAMARFKAMHPFDRAVWIAVVIANFALLGTDHTKVALVVVVSWAVGRQIVK